MKKKKTLNQIRREFNKDRVVGVTIKDVAERAKLPVGVVYTVELGGHCTQYAVAKVVHALADLTGLPLTIADA